MPYLRCVGCGVVSYAPAGRAGTVCPECGVPWPGSLDEVVRTEDPAGRIEVILRMTRDLLDVDLALLTEVRDGEEIARGLAGAWPGVSLEPGASSPLGDTLCHRMLEGEIDNLVADARGDERTRSVPMVRRFGIGAWMGVPIPGPQAELYVLCCLAREARPGLGPREVKLLSGLAESIRAELSTGSLVPTR